MQLNTRFLEDNSHFQLLSSIPSAASDITSIFLHSVVDCAYSFTSTRHLDMTSTNSPVEDIVLVTRYTISTLSETEIEILSKVYHQVFPNIFDQDESLYLPRSYRKLLCVTIKGQKVKAGEYVWTKGVYQFTNSGAPPIQILMFIQQKFIISFHIPSKSVTLNVALMLLHLLVGQCSTPYNIALVNLLRCGVFHSMKAVLTIVYYQ